jgi:hypothetical protein
LISICEWHLLESVDKYHVILLKSRFKCLFFVIVYSLKYFKNIYNFYISPFVELVPKYT